MRLSSRFTGHWMGFVQAQRDLQEGELRKASVGLTYSDECFLIQTVYERDKFEDRDLEPDNRFLLKVVLKHLGEFGNE